MIPEESASVIFSEERLEYFVLNGGLINYGFTYEPPNYYIVLNDNGKFMLEHNEPYKCDIKLYKNMMKI